MIRKHNKTKKNNKIRSKIRVKSRRFRKNKIVPKRFHYKKKKPLKGGDMKSINVRTNFEDIPNASDYDLIYIAIGAKYHTNYPSNMINTGEYQLMPMFLMAKSLIIIIDTFSDEELRLNEDVIRSQYLKTRDTDVDDFDVFIINHEFDREISEKIVEFLSTRENTTMNLWICSYVVFLSPSPSNSEKEIEKSVDNNCNYIASINNKQFENNVYKWLGNLNHPRLLCIKSKLVSVLFILSKRIMNLKEKELLQKNTINIYSNYYELEQ